MSRILEIDRQRLWDERREHGHASPRPRDKFALRVIALKAPLSPSEAGACSRLWGDLNRAGGGGGGAEVFVDGGSPDFGATAVDQGAALRRAAEAMGFVLRHLRSDVQRRIFARVFDTSPATRMDYPTVLRDCGCHHATLDKGVQRAASLLVIHYDRIDAKTPLTGGANIST